MGIKEDKARFMNIVKGKIKKDLSKHVSHGEIIGKKEDEFVRIPIPQIDIPNFRFGDKNEEQGVGQGEGDGDGQGQPGPSQGKKPGQEAGEHQFQTEISVDDLATILGEVLELPKILPKGNKSIEVMRTKYTSIAPVGPKGLKHFKTTFKRALKRSLVSGSFEKDKVIIPVRDDFRYKSPKPVTKPQTKAVIFYIMDISGSMGNEQKQIVQTETFWINTWLKKHYKNLDIRFIVHDAVAQEVSEDQFFTISAAGGTLISSSYNLCQKLIETEYPPSDFNIYIFQFSDGDNWSEEDNRKCVKMIKDYFSPIVNSFNYGQVDSPHGSGGFIKILEHLNISNLVTSTIRRREDILDSIKKFLGKGR